MLQWVVEGRTSADIAKRLHLSPRTVDTYRRRLLRKLGLESSAARVKFAVEDALTPR